MPKLLSGPMQKAGLYLLMIGCAIAAMRLINHSWPPVVGFSAVPALAYYVWRKERALEERTRKAD